MSEHGDKLVALVTLLLVIVTVASIFVAWRLGKRQEVLQRELAQLALKHEKDLAEQARKNRAEEQKLQEELTRRQRLFEQRSQLIPMWQYISALSDINPEKPVTPDVIKAANTLEFIAVCCEAEVVDRMVVMRTFRNKYIELYEKIERCGPLPGFEPKKTGRELLTQTAAATSMYRALEVDRLAADRPTTLADAS
jgi:sensor c-di-GMP phosphodiesterase-like protein